MGHKISADGLRVDPEKVNATTWYGELRTFAPCFSEATAPLRQLIKTESEFYWDDQVHAEHSHCYTCTGILRYK